MTDHVRNLRLCSHPFVGGPMSSDVRATMRAAADEIERLSLEVERLSEEIRLLEERYVGVSND